MHNIKDIRNNFENFKNIIKSRNISIDLDKILNLDQNRQMHRRNPSLGVFRENMDFLQDL